MKKNSFLLAFSLATVLLSCKKEMPTVNEPQTKSFEQLQKAKWLIGQWGANFPDGSMLSETWQKDNDSTFSAKSVVVAGKDTVFSESVSLGQRAGKLLYVVSVSGQNQEEPIAFELISATDSRLVFENAKHDYPQKITYNKFENDSLSAEIWGIQDGKQKSEVFPMKKQNK